MYQKTFKTVSILLLSLTLSACLSFDDIQRAISDSQAYSLSTTDLAQVSGNTAAVGDWKAVVNALETEADRAREKGWVNVQAALGIREALIYLQQGQANVANALKKEHFNSCDTLLAARDKALCNVWQSLVGWSQVAGQGSFSSEDVAGYADKFYEEAKKYPGVDNLDIHSYLLQEAAYMGVKIVRQINEMDPKRHTEFALQAQSFFEAVSEDGRQRFQEIYCPTTGTGLSGAAINALSRATPAARVNAIFSEYKDIVADTISVLDSRGDPKSVKTKWNNEETKPAWAECSES